MAIDIVPLEPLERGQLHVMRVRGAFTALVLIGLAVAAELILAERFPLPGLVAAPVLLIAIWVGLIAPSRRWRHWGYAFTGSELHVAHGWLFQVHTIVPVVRVQHIDVAQGPLQRAFGVATLVLHTAGTDASTVGLPGISRETAEDIRDSIRARIGSAQ
ncbi:PH domain-containing protein [Sphingomonas canadensis]|uniref:PH domain-containing protein n=1 Tax=Sphingomonas canadensis TaxID=1219257 RepID=A0ABW3HA09_9SPHN|nr:PH domain-containing protein [Sphingomonas canadensis]MCW3837920.1 PH domain-containing protein [Sphingomonas canadensis]